MVTEPFTDDKAFGVPVGFREQPSAPVRASASRHSARQAATISHPAADSTSSGEASGLRPDSSHLSTNKELTHKSWRSRSGTPEGVNQADGHLNRTRQTRDASAVRKQRSPRRRRL
jgi:hypothetical protein